MLHKVPESASIFRIHRFCWQILGYLPSQRYTTLYFIYSFVLIATYTIGFPIHLTSALINSDNKDDMFRTFAISLTSYVCTTKTLLYWWKMHQVQEITKMLSKLDARISQSAAEVIYYKATVLPAVKRIFYIFQMICISVTFSSEGAVLISGIFSEWRLMYASYFPFDPFASVGNYVVAHMYQFIGFCVQIIQNLTSDTYGGMALALLAGHVHLLGIRVANLGYDKTKTLAQNNAELLACIQDHKNLLHFYHVVQDIISLIMFTQIIFLGINACIVMLYLLFYANDAFSYIFYIMYLTGLLMQTFPCCYYGSHFEMEFGHFTYSIFSCNWLDQSKEFKQNLRIFIEQSLKSQNFLANNIFQINLATFFATCKGAYSLFAIVLRMK